MRARLQKPRLRLDLKLGGKTVEQRVTVTPDRRLDYGISNVMNEAGDALMSEGRSLAYSATGTVTDVQKSLTKDQSGGFVENAVARSEILINGKTSVVRQVDAGANTLVDVRDDGVTAYLNMEIMDGAGKLLRSRSSQARMDDRRSYDASTNYYGTSHDLVFRKEEDCRILKVGGGETNKCDGTIYDNQNQKMATYKSSLFKSRDGATQIIDNEFYNKEGAFLGTVHGEVKKDNAQRQATINVSITDKRQ